MNATQPRKPARAAAGPAAGPEGEDDAALPAAEDRLAARVRLACRTVSVALCCLHAYANRHLINPDGLSYLDLATGDGTPNGYWSPLYPWLLGAALRLIRPAPYAECAVAHAVNVGLFLVSLAAFEWLLAEALRANRRARSAATWDVPLPDWAVTGLAYALFSYAARRLVTVSLVTPDMLVAAAAYAGAALLLRLRRSDSPRSAFALGVVVGLGFLAKAVMFPLGCLFVGLSALCGPRRQAGRRLALAAVAFAALASVVVVPLSLARGGLTYGESGRLNYLWYVLEAPRPELLGELTGRGASLVTLLPESRGTYALWYDPSVHFEAYRPHFDLRAQAAASLRVALTYFELASDRMAVFSVVVAVVLGYSFFARRGRAREWGRVAAVSLGGTICCLVPALAGLGLYLLVGHAEGRLVGPFLVLLALAVLAAVRLCRTRQAAARPLAAALLTPLGLVFAGNLLFDLGNALSAARAGEGGPAHPHALVAEELRREGLAPGDPVGSVGFTYNAYWARLAGATVRAEVPQHRARLLWASPRRDQERTLEAFRRAGVGFIVCDCLPPGVTGWRRVAGTPFAYRRVGP